MIKHPDLNSLAKRCPRFASAFPVAVDLPIHMIRIIGDSIVWFFFIEITLSNHDCEQEADTDIARSALLCFVYRVNRNMLLLKEDLLSDDTPRVGTRIVRLSKNWFFCAIVVILLLGYKYPAAGLGVQQFLKPLIFVSMFLIGIRQDFSSLMASIKDYKAIVVCMLNSYLVAPLVGYLLAWMFFGPAGMIYAGVMIGGAVCTTMVSAVVWTGVSKGNESLAIVLSILSSVGCAFLTPCILYFFIHQIIQMSVGKMMTDLLLIMIPPVVLSQFIRCVWKFDYGRVSALSRVFGQLIILSTVLMATSSFTGMRLPLIVSLLMLAFLQFTFIALFSYKVSRLFSPRRNAIAIMYCSTLKSVPAAALIAMTYFTPAAGVYILFYHIVQQVMSQYAAKLINRSDSKIPIQDTGHRASMDTTPCIYAHYVETIRADCHSNETSKRAMDVSAGPQHKQRRK
jgi:predicted Na+-dependent transporter